MLQVAVVHGSKNDWDDIVRDSALTKIFAEVGVEVRYVCCSAHRNWEELPGVIQQLVNEGVVMFIAVAGRAAVLSGMINAITNGEKLVVAVPLANPEVPAGMDSFLASATCPPGTSVLTAGAAYHNGMLTTAAEAACQAVSLVDETVRNSYHVYRLAQKAKKPVILDLEAEAA